MPDFMISLRTPDGKAPGTAPRYLRIDGDITSDLDPPAWIRSLTAGFEVAVNPARGPLRTGNILFFVHGFNDGAAEVLARHRKIRASLEGLSWKGELVSFDWYSAGLVFEYLPDRAHARAAASMLVTAGIALLEKAQERDCPITIDVMAHSMGAFVLQQAFTWAYQDVPPGWTVGQILLVAGDVDYTVFDTDNYSSKMFARHAARLTNYFSRFDKALAVSNAKRMDVAPRAGRVGFPSDTPDMMCQVDCSELFAHTYRSIEARLDPALTHAFYFDQPAFWQDAMLTLAGGIDRAQIPTRTALPDQANSFALNTEARPEADFSLDLAAASNLAGPSTP